MRPPLSYAPYRTLAYPITPYLHYTYILLSHLDNINTPRANRVPTTTSPPLPPPHHHHHHALVPTSLPPPPHDLATTSPPLPPPHHCPYLTTTTTTTPSPLPHHHHHHHHHHPHDFPNIVLSLVSGQCRNGFVSATPTSSSVRHISGDFDRYGELASRRCPVEIKTRPGQKVNVSLQNFAHAAKRRLRHHGR